MALHLNLFHEIEKQKALKARDPLKLSMYGIGLVAAGLAGYYALQFASASAASSELSRVEAEYNKLKPQAEKAVKRKEELAGSIKISDTFVKRIEGRFYWASVLQNLTELVPSEVQITKLNGEIASDAARHGTLILEGISAGAEPRKVAEDLRRNLIDKFSPQYKHVAATFALLDDGKEGVRMGGQVMPTAAFTIKLTLQLLEDEAPPPPPKAGKKAAAKEAIL
jgi:Tfp pilus assembly protein PilN